MNKKSGSPGSLVAPVAPQDATEAAVADPGAITEASGDPAKLKTAKVESQKVGAGTASDSSGSSPAPPHQPPETEEEKAVKTSWIEIELVGEDGKPIPGEWYRVLLPDGTADEGTLDHKGFARIEGFAPGSCKVSFPDLDQDAWEDA